MAGWVVHYEIPASDVDRAQRFWSGLLGWEFGESVMPEGDYRMARTGEQSGAALMQGDTGHPKVYFDVDDIDAALEFAAKIPAARMGGLVEVRPLVER